MISPIWKSICTSNYKQIFSLYYASLIWTHQNSCLLIFLLNSTDSIKIKISNSIHFSKSKIFQLQNFNRYLNTYFFLSHQNCIKISNEKLTNFPISNFADQNFHYSVLKHYQNQSRIYLFYSFHSKFWLFNEDQTLRYVKDINNHSQ